MALLAGDLPEAGVLVGLVGHYHSLQIGNRWEGNWSTMKSIFLVESFQVYTFCVVLHLLDPLFQVLEALSLVDVVDEDGSVGRAEEVLAEVDVLLLPRGVPEIGSSGKRRTIIINQCCQMANFAA